MFLQDDAGGPKSLSEIVNNLKSELVGMQSAILNFEVQAKKVSAQTFGQGAAFAKEIRHQLADSAKFAALLGVRIDGVADSMNAVAKAFGTNVRLSNSQLNNMIAFQAATNISAESLGKLIEGFATIGVGTNQALESLTAMRKQSNAYGLNTAQFMETVADNIKLMNSYNFRGGVEGFTKMVARSQALRINMADVKGLAGDLLNPEKAIELAAEMQMLGGSIAGLSDPFQLMNMAQNDMEGLQKAIIDTAAASVSFNQTSGSFDISATEMRRLRAQATALGMDYEELANTAVKAAQKQEAMGQLRFTNLTPEEQEFLSNIGQFDGGELKFKLPDIDELKSASELSKDELVQLKKLSETQGLSNEAVAKQQLTTLQSIDATLKSQLIGIQGEIAGGGIYDDMTGRLKGSATAVNDTITSIFPEDGGPEKLNEFFKLQKNELDNLMLKINGGDKTILGVMNSIGGYVVESISDIASRAADSLGGAGTADAIGAAVESGMARALTGNPLNMNVSGNIGLQAQNIDFSTMSQTQVQDLSARIQQYMGSNLLGTSQNTA